MEAYVVGSIRMVVYPAKERRRCVLPNIFLQQVGSAGVFVEEGANVVNESRDEDERAFL